MACMIDSGKFNQFVLKDPVSCMLFKIRLTVQQYSVTGTYLYICKSSIYTHILQSNLILLGISDVAAWYIIGSHNIYPDLIYPEPAHQCTGPAANNSQTMHGWMSKLMVLRFPPPHAYHGSPYPIV